jgi:hypothetical protein
VSIFNGSGIEGELRDELAAVHNASRHLYAILPI